MWRVVLPTTGVHSLMRHLVIYYVTSCMQHWLALFYVFWQPERTFGRSPSR